MRPRPHGDRRRGTVLVYFAMLAFGLFALAALVIDVGFAILTRRQMQTAVDSAALEGLRLRDHDNAMIDRRERASDLVNSIFDDDLEPENGDQRNFGAGPVVELSEGMTDLNALQTITGLGVYKPFRSDGTPGLERNEADEEHGDMVSGRYLDGDDHTEGPTLVQSSRRPYERADFEAGNGDTSFLVRMRRTNDFDGLDNIDGVSSSGPSLPFLFGRGSLIHRDYDSSTPYNPRQHGITVRATAIADARPVMAVGRPVEPDPSVNFPGVAGVTPFGLRLSFWLDPQRFPQGTSIRLDSDADGRLSANPPPPNGLPDGQFLKWPTTPQPRLPSIGWRISSVRVNSPEWPSSLALARYVPLFDVVDNEDWVVGFGLIEVNQTTPLMITKQRGIIARENAAGVLIDGTDSFPGPVGSGTTLQTVISMNQALRQTAPDLVLVAPTLVR